MIVRLTELLCRKGTHSLLVGSDLSSFGRDIGTPDYWDFGCPKPLSIGMAYGNYMLDFVSVSNELILKEIRLKLWEADVENDRAVPIDRPPKFNNQFRVRYDLPDLPVSPDKVRELPMLPNADRTEIQIDDVTEICLFMEYHSLGLRFNFFGKEAPYLAEVVLS